jgi:hypothetical protein
LIPVGAQKIRVRLPHPLRARSLRLLVARQSPTFQQKGEWLEVTVPAITAHEVIAINV